MNFNFNPVNKNNAPQEPEPSRNNETGLAKVTLRVDADCFLLCDGEYMEDIEIVANKLNAPELGINLIAKFSSINLSNEGNVLKIGDNISTVVEVINRLKTPTDQQKALNRDVFYKEGVAGVQEIFEQYFSRLKLDNMD